MSTEELEEPDREVDDFLERSARAHKRRLIEMRERRERDRKERRREQLLQERTSAPWRHYLREWRHERGMSLQDLSISTGISKEMISRYETLKRGLSIDVQYRLIAALHIKPSQFFHEPGSPIARLLDEAEAASEEQLLAALAELQRKA